MLIHFAIIILSLVQVFGSNAFVLSNENNFSDLDQLSFNELFDMNLHPKIQVQTKFMEGWEDLDIDKEVAVNRIVISMFYKNLTDGGGRIPVHDGVIRVRTAHDQLTVWTESDDRVVKHVLNSQNDTEFKTNLAGRVTLIAPLANGNQILWTMPHLLIQSPRFMDNEWLRAPIHTDLLHQLENIDTLALSKVFDGDNAIDKAKLVRNIATMHRVKEYHDLLQSSEQHFAKSKFDKRHLLNERSLSRALLSANGDYDAYTNTVGTHLTQLMSQDDSPLGDWNNLETARPLPEPGRIQIRTNVSDSEQSDGAASAAEVLEFDSNDSGRLVLSQNRLCKRSIGLRQLGRSVHDFGSSAMLIGDFGLSTLSLVLVFDSVNPYVILKRILQAFRLDWTATLSTQQVIRHYAIIQTPLMKAALETVEGPLVTRKLEESFDKAAASPAFIFHKLFGQRNLTDDAMQRITDRKISKLVRFNDTQLNKLVNKNNVRAAQVQDMLLDNAHRSDLFDKNDSESYMAKAKSLHKDVVEKIHSEMQSIGGASATKDMFRRIIKDFKGINGATPIVFLTRLIQGFHQVSSFVYLMPIVPKMLDLLTGLYTMRIRIPYVRRFYMRYIAQGQHDLTLLDLYSLMSAVLAQFSYQLIFPHKPFFTQCDAAVITQVSNPMTILYHWMRDDRTRPLEFASGSKGYDVIQHERECALDWMTRFAMLFSTDFGYQLGRVESSLSSRARLGAATIVSLEVVGQIKAMCWFLANAFMYPTDQVNTLDPQVIQSTFENPDPIWYGWWRTGYMAVLTKVLAPFWELPYYIKHYDNATTENEHGLVERTKNVGEWLDAIVNFATTISSVYYTVLAMADYIAKLNLTNTGRTMVATVNSLAWYYDCKSQIMPYIEDLQEKLFSSYEDDVVDPDAPHKSSRDTFRMLKYYRLRVLLMMRFKIYGLSEYRVPAIPDSNGNSSLTGL